MADGWWLMFDCDGGTARAKGVVIKRGRNNTKLL